MKILSIFKLLAGVALMLSLAACADDSITRTLTAAPTHTRTPARTPTGPLQTARVSARVLRVVDGDTIDVDIGGKTYRVRYIGIDTPEVYGQIEYYGREASAKNRELVEGKIVVLEKDVSETDKYGRLLRYVYVGSLFVNAELVRLGYAQVATYPPDVRYADYFLQLQQEARTAGRGLWGAPPSATPLPQPEATRAGGNCHPAYPDVCIPPPPPDLDCKDIPYRNFRLLPPDPHRFDGDRDGIGCER